MYRTRRADLSDDDDIDHLRDLHKLTFLEDAPMPDFENDYPDPAWWLMYCAGIADPIGFAGSCQSTMGSEHCYFWRVGVLPEHKGHGLGRRLIRIAERRAITAGYQWMISDTCGAIQSANNFIKSGYQMFEPEVEWALSGAQYWRKRLVSPAAR